MLSDLTITDHEAFYRCSFFSGKGPALPRHEVDIALNHTEAFPATSADTAKAAAAPIRLKRAMPAETVDEVRRLRYENLLALVTRESIRNITGPKGIFATLNPERLEVLSFEETRYSALTVGTTQQMWGLIRSVSTLAAHLSWHTLQNMAKQARRQAELLGSASNGASPLEREADIAGFALHIFRTQVIRREQHFVEAELPHVHQLIEEMPYSETDKAALTTRMLEVAWLWRRNGGKTMKHKSLSDLDGTLAANLQRSAKDAANAAELMTKLDEPIEKLLTKLRDKQVAIRRCKAAAVQIDDAHELERSHPAYAGLAEERARVMRGELSVVGGSAYPAMRFSETFLHKVCSGKMPVICFNGRHEDGLAYARRRFGASKESPDLLEPCWMVDIKGVYGDFPRTAIYFPDGSAVAVISFWGLSRAVSNAGALILYRDEENRRVPLEKLMLVNGVADLRAKMAEDLGRVLRESEKEMDGQEILGVPVASTRELPTQPAIMIHPSQLESAYGSEIVIKQYDGDSLGTVNIAFIKNPDGGITRVIVPTVGGSGLYGDTAGYFVDAVFTAGMAPNLIPHIFFNATSGACAGTDFRSDFKQNGVRGLPRVRPSGLIMPQKKIFSEFGMLEMNTILEAAKSAADPHAAKAAQDFEAALKEAGVHCYDNHYCVPHPAIETYEFIVELMAKHHVSSADVEAWWIQRAVSEATERYPHATFTPIYCWSDDPRNGKQDRHLMLAYGGPLHHNWEPDPTLNPVLRAQFDLAYLSRKSLFAI